MIQRTNRAGNLSVRPPSSTAVIARELRILFCCGDQRTGRLGSRALGRSSWLAFLQQLPEVGPVRKGEDEGRTRLAPVLSVVSRLQGRAQGIDHRLGLVAFQLEVRAQVEEVRLVGGRLSRTGDCLFDISEGAVVLIEYDQGVPSCGVECGEVAGGQREGAGEGLLGRL